MDRTLLQGMQPLLLLLPSPLPCLPIWACLLPCLYFFALPSSHPAHPPTYSPFPQVPSPPLPSHPTTPSLYHYYLLPAIPFCTLFSAHSCTRYAFYFAIDEAAPTYVLN